MNTVLRASIIGGLSLALLLSIPVHANTATVTRGGIITLNGQITDVSATNDSFTLSYNDEKIEVSMDQIDEETLDQLIDTGIIARDSYVTVTGRIEDDVTGAVIKANAVSVYGE